MSDESLKYDPRYVKTEKPKVKGKGKAKQEKVDATHSPITPNKKSYSSPSFPQYPLHSSLSEDKLHNTNLTDSSSPYDFLNGKPNTYLQSGTRDISRALGQSPSVPSPLQNGMLPGSINSSALNPTHMNTIGANAGNGYFAGTNQTKNGRPLADTIGLRPSRHNFQSMAVNMEYSTISNILTSSNSKNKLGHSEITSSVSPSVNSTTGEDSPGPKLELHSNNNNQQVHHPKSNSTSHINNNYLHASLLNQFSLGPVGTEQAQNLSQALETVEQLNQQNNSHDWYSESSVPRRPLSFTISNMPIEHSGEQTDKRNGSTSSASSSTSSTYHWQYREPADIYANVRQPFSYTPAYHQLTIYIRTRFKRDQQMRIAKCMASYRPSFIACTNTLKEDDLIFMEQCFQRTLLEYEKFISYSGTPTLVWRRTGQVAAVGKEFCILTGWPRERLLNEHTFIVELMDDSSALEYFEMFSKMAFGDSRGANMTECTLLTPQGQHIKTSSIWTLKRDVFGIPMMIVGNFLPILP